MLVVSKLLQNILLLLDNLLPSTYKDAKNLLIDLDVDYRVYHACLDPLELTKKYNSMCLNFKTSHYWLYVKGKIAP